MNSRSRSTLFLMEQLIVILVFAICAAACVKIFVGSYTMARDSRDMSSALLRAESAAECFKAFSGDYGRVAEALSGTVDADGAVAVYYDKNWRVCGESGAAYVMRVGDGSPADAPASLAFADILVVSNGGGEIIDLTVAARGGAG